MASELNFILLCFSCCKVMAANVERNAKRKCVQTDIESFKFPRIAQRADDGIPVFCNTCNNHRLHGLLYTEFERDTGKTKCVITSKEDAGQRKMSAQVKTVLVIKAIEELKILFKD